MFSNDPSQSIWKLDVKVIKVGSCTVDPANAVSLPHIMLKNQLGIGGGSTATIIIEDNEILLIDTGYDFETDTSTANMQRNWNNLRTSLESNGISADEITKIFITHFHRDHFGCIEYFQHADWYCLDLSSSEIPHEIIQRFIALEDGEHILPNVAIINTPGHTRDHSSLLYTNENKTVRIAVSGDAIINLAWLQSGKIWKFNSGYMGAETAKESIKRILKESDIVIPGHGQPFFVTDKLIELYE